MTASVPARPRDPRPAGDGDADERPAGDDGRPAGDAGERPADVPITETWRTLRDELPPAPVRVLEVGAGDGALAARIQAAGYDVTALDVSAEAVAAATARGVRAVAGDLLAYQGGPFDVVLFTRSLHHIHPLGAATERARALLRPGGMLIVDDFRFENADEPTASWLADREAELARRGLLTEIDYWRRPDATPLQAWHEHHRDLHDVHRGDDLDRAIAERFEVQDRSASAYLYRYLCSRLRPEPGAADEGRRLLAAEHAAIASGAIRAIGYRWRARRAS